MTSSRLATFIQPRQWFQSLVDWALNTEGSTRTAALIRVGLVFVAWSRWGNELLLYKDLSTESILLWVNFWLASSLMIMGLFTRFTSLWMAAVVMSMYYYFGFIRGVEAWTHHHIYVLSFGIFLCALTPSGKSYSVDRWLAVRRARQRGEPLPDERGNLFGLRLIALQLSVVYFASAFDKMTVPYLNGNGLEQIIMWYYTGSDYPSIPGFHIMVMLAAWSVIALELSLAFGMHFPQTRRWLIFAGLSLHGVIYITLPVRTFSATMFVLYLAYLNADQVHGWIDQLQGYTPSGQAQQD